MKDIQQKKDNYSMEQCNTALDFIEIESKILRAKLPLDKIALSFKLDPLKIPEL